MKKVEEEMPGNAVAQGGVNMAPNMGPKMKAINVTDRRRRKDKQPVMLKRFRTYMDSTFFVAGTEISMEDGSNKLIEDVQIGDYLNNCYQSSDSDEQGNANKVLEFDHPLLGDRKLYGFNKQYEGGRGDCGFVTAEHPFLTTEGWKAIDIDATIIEQPNINVTMVGNLKVGDVMIMNDGLKTVISSIEQYTDLPDRQLYNFKLDGDNTYIANEYIVHNKGSSNA